MKHGRVLARLAVSCLAGLFSWSGAPDEDSAPPVEAAPVTSPYFGQPTAGDVYRVDAGVLDRFRQTPD